ncbi:mRNA export factor GLE1 isoform 3-T3 [Pholidichthys leucotaenia]
MQSESLRWETLQALKESPKGRISFDPHWCDRGEHILHGYKEVFSLSPHSVVILERLSSLPLQKSSFLGSSSGDCSPGLSDEVPDSVSSPGSIPDHNTRNSTLSAAPSVQNKQDQQIVNGEAKDGNREADISSVSSRSSLTSISIMSPKAMNTAGCIIRYEEEHRKKAKLALRMRQEMQEKVVEEVASVESEHLKRFEELMELKQRQEFQSIRDMMDRETKESMGRQEKLKEEQRHRMKILNLRLREVEQQRLREAELEKQRQAEGRERLRNLNTIQEEILQLNQLLEPSTQTKSDLPPASFSSYSTRGNQLCSQVSEVVRKTAEGEFPSVEDMTVAERALHEMRALIRLMQEEASKAQEKKKKEQEHEEERKKQAALQAQQEVQKKAVQVAKEKAQKKGLQNSADDSTVKWYKELQESEARFAKSIEEFSSSKDTEKQGEEEVAAHHEAAFPIAVVASGLWELHPQVGDLILAHLHKKCPYAVPWYPPMKNGMSVEEYQRILGYRIEDSKVEDQYIFLKRMSGMIRLYAAIIQLKWPYSSKQESASHGLQHGWRWLAQMLNMEPVADITATLLLDFLEVCGNALMKQYQAQFWKLILLLKEEYFPRIEAVTTIEQMGSVNRLREFLVASLKSRQISLPKGQLTSGFWRS